MNNNSMALIAIIPTLNALDKLFGDLGMFNPDINAIWGLAKPAGHGGQIDMVYAFELSPGKLSQCEIKAHYDLHYGNGWQRDEYSIAFCWTTCSGHVVEIHGERKGDTGDFRLFIGLDASENFYPQIIDLALAIPGVLPPVYDVKPADGAPIV